MEFIITKTAPDYDRETKTLLPPCAGSYEKCPEKIGHNKEWFIKFDTIDDLMKFIIENDRVIIARPYNDGDLTEIEIYNAYRE